MKRKNIVTKLAVSALLATTSVITPAAIKTADNVNNVQIEQVVNADFDRDNCIGTVTLVPVVGNSPASNPISKSYGASWHFKFVNGKCVSQPSYTFHAWHIAGYHLVDSSQETMTITSDMVNSYGLTQAVVEYAPNKTISNSNKNNNKSAIIGNYETREGMHSTKGRGRGGNATYNNPAIGGSHSSSSRNKIKKVNHSKKSKNKPNDKDDYISDNDKPTKSTKSSNDKTFYEIVATGVIIAVGFIVSGIMMIKKH